MIQRTYTLKEIADTLLTSAALINRLQNRTGLAGESRSGKGFRQYYTGDDLLLIRKILLLRVIGVPYKQVKYYIDNWKDNIETIKKKREVFLTTINTQLSGVV